MGVYKIQQSLILYVKYRKPNKMASSKSIILLVFSLVIKSMFVFSQDVHFSQNFVNTTYNAPSFAGAAEDGRFISTYRNQWPSIPQAYVSYFLSGDYYFAKKNSGVGINFLRDISGEGTLYSSSTNLQYSYKVKINAQSELRPGIEVSFSTKKIDYNKLYFKDQLLSGSSVSSYESYPNDHIWYPDAGASLLYINGDNWGGFSVKHLFKPNNSFYSTESKLPFYYSVFAGTKLDINGGLYTLRDEYLQLSILYKSQQKFDQTDFGLYLQKKDFGFGLHYRGIPIVKAYKKGYANNDALIMIVGFRHKKIKVYYSFDFSVSRLFSYSGNAHEISFVYEINPDALIQKRIKKVACPKFIDGEAF